MFLFSADPYWTTYILGMLVIVAGAFRFGASGAWVSGPDVAPSYNLDLAVGSPPKVPAPNTSKPFQQKLCQKPTAKRR